MPEADPFEGSGRTGGKPACTASLRGIIKPTGDTILAGDQELRSAHSRSGRGSDMAVIDDVTEVLGETLQLGARTNDFTAETALFGAIPEFDSMAVVTVVTALEDRFGIFDEDDEIEVEVLATVGSLAAFLTQKLEA